MRGQNRKADGRRMAPSTSLNKDLMPLPSATLTLAESVLYTLRACQIVGIYGNQTDESGKNTDRRLMRLRQAAQSAWSKRTSNHEKQLLNRLSRDGNHCL